MWPDLSNLRVEISEEEILTDLLYPHARALFQPMRTKKRPPLIQ
jgi:hypothetical protein